MKALQIFVEVRPIRTDEKTVEEFRVDDVENIYVRDWSFIPERMIQNTKFKVVQTNHKRIFVARVGKSTFLPYFSIINKPTNYLILLLITAKFLSVM